jgi:hypothetical protein
VISAYFPGKLFIVSTIAPGARVTDLMDSFDIAFSVTYPISEWGVAKSSI